MLEEFIVIHYMLIDLKNFGFETYDYEKQKCWLKLFLCTILNVVCRARI